MSVQDFNSTLAMTLGRLLRPIVKVMLRNGIPLEAFNRILKKVYVEEAKNELQIPGKKLSHSRISVVTGVPRKDIKKILESPLSSKDHFIHQFNRASRVITGWIHDGQFLHEGKPADLEMEGEKGFEELVKQYSGGVPPKAILDELLRIGSVRKIEDGKVRLVSYGYVDNEDQLQAFMKMSQQAGDLLNTMIHNVDNPKEESRLQLASHCDNLPMEILGRLENLVSERGQVLLQELVAFLNKYDRDQNDAVFGTGRFRAGIGIYYFQEDISHQNDQDNSNAESNENL
ncbi:MAG: hypothetical protein HQL32_05455 [Planctomycetes bacterium]|nr:hypothetical protein [Planctomycetota bacterium]